MNRTIEIDFLLTLDGHGWSTCWIVIPDKQPIELTITHAFYRDPYVDLMDALSRLIKGESLVSFFWYGEPGGERIEIERNPEQHHLLNVRIDGFYESFADEITDFAPTIHFEMKKSQFIVQFYFQLKKIETLLREPSFAKERAGDFAPERFKEFELEVKNYLKLD
ncbi:MAG: hypothetical protein ACO1N0_10270 [Fluviicola sp.]